MERPDQAKGFEILPKGGLLKDPGMVRALPPIEPRLRMSDFYFRCVSVLIFDPAAEALRWLKYFPDSL